MLLTVVWSGVVSFIAYKVVDLTIGLRVSEEDERQGLDEVLGDGVMGALGCSEVALCGGPLGAGVEVGRDAGDAVDALRRELAAGDQPVEQPRLVELAHLHGVFHGLTGAPEHRGLRCAGEGDDVQVQRGREPPVQTQLLPAAMGALVERAEVEEAEIERLLDLVGVVAGEKDPGDVGLHQPQAPHRVGVEAGLEQAPDVQSAGGVRHCGSGRVTADPLPPERSTDPMQRYTPKTWRPPSMPPSGAIESPPIFAASLRPRYCTSSATVG